MSSLIEIEKLQRVVLGALGPLAVLGLCLADSAWANPGIEAAYEAAAYNQFEFRLPLDAGSGRLNFPSQIQLALTETQSGTTPTRQTVRENSTVAADSSSSNSDSGDSDIDDQEEAEPEHSLLHKVILYLPNRIFDIFDLVRFRVRVGPGLGGGFRATKVAQLYLGSSVAVFAGLPGPRQHPSIPLPVGVEMNNKAAVSVLDAEANGGLGPDYSPTEFGAGVQLLLLGFDIGVDPVEAVDLLGGIGGFDLRDDDF